MQALRRAFGPALALIAMVSVAQAAEQHEGDIQPYSAGGQIRVTGTLFEADFGDLARGPYRTRDPGFDVDTDAGALGAGNWLRYQAIGKLRFWNGSAWTSALPDGEYVTLEDALGEVTQYTGSGVVNPVGVIGQADADGDIHSHLDFSVYTGAGDLGGTAGAYWIGFTLFETLPWSLEVVSDHSAPINVVFNRGLSSEAFETAVSAVPLPAAVWLFGSALAGLAVLRRNADGA